MGFGDESRPDGFIVIITPLRARCQNGAGWTGSHGAKAFSSRRRWAAIVAASRVLINLMVVSGRASRRTSW
jgi:hypothetical protein